MEFDKQLERLRRSLDVRRLTLQMNAGAAGGPLECLISDKEGDVCVHAVIFRDMNDNPDIFVRSFSSDTAAYVVPLIEKIGDTSATLNATRLLQERNETSLN